MKKLLVLVLLVTLPMLAAGTAHATGYPAQYCNNGANPSACTYVSTGTPLPVTVSATSAGAVAAMGATMAHATLGEAVRCGLYRYNTAQWEAVDTTHPLPAYISADGSHFVSAAYPFSVRINSTATDPMDATHPLVVSANATANAANNPFHVRVSADGTNPVDGTHPLVAQLTDGTAVRPPPWAKFDDDAAANCVAITSSSVQFTLPAAGWYYLTAVGNTAYILCGTNPTATLTVTTGFSIVIAEGSERLRYLTGPKCAVIGASTNGSLCFGHLNPSL